MRFFPRRRNDDDSDPTDGSSFSRIFFQLSGVCAAAGFLVLLLGDHWYDAFVPWAISALIYYLGRRVVRKERAARLG